MGCGRWCWFDDLQVIFQPMWFCDCDSMGSAEYRTHELPFQPWSQQINPVNPSVAMTEVGSTTQYCCCSAAQGIEMFLWWTFCPVLTYCIKQLFLICPVLHLYSAVSYSSSQTLKKQTNTEVSKSVLMVAMTAFPGFHSKMTSLPEYNLQHPP